MDLSGLRASGISVELIDKRPRGALWIVGGRELAELMTKLATQGLRFTYSPTGSKGTGYRPAWFIMEHGEK